MVQTFLPYANFYGSARILDNKRLYKQIVEAKQLRLAVFAHDTGCIYYCDDKYKNYPKVQKFHKRGDDIVYLTAIPEHAILNKFGKPKKVGWQQHLAAKQWFGYYEALTKYQIVMLEEWLRRTWVVSEPFIEIEGINNESIVDMPKWFGLSKYHDSHKSRLHQKDSIIYSCFSKYDKGEGYYWPV